MAIIIIIIMRSRVYVTSGVVRLSRRSTAAAACDWFAAERRRRVPAKFNFCRHKKSTANCTPVTIKCRVKQLRLKLRYLESLAAGLVDEDDWYEHGKALLGEASDVANEKAEVESHDYQQNDRHPRADPETKRHEVHSVLTAIATISQSINQ